MFSRSPFMLSSLGPLGRAPITELDWPCIDSAAGESSTALLRAATHLVQVNWKHPAFSKHGFHHKLELGERVQIWDREREQALTSSLRLWENWVSWGKWRRDGAVLARSRSSAEDGGNFLGFLFYNNFHKILFECISCLRHLRFLAQQILGLVIFCPLSR